MSPTSATPAVVAVEKLSFTFVGREAPTLSDVSFQLDAATWTLVTGRTGSGKSTLLRALAGLIPRHTAGAITGSVQTIMRGLADARGLQPPGVRGGPTVQLLLQAADDQLCATTVAAEVAFGLENLALPADEIAARMHTSLERFGLAGLEATPNQHLSGGQKQRLLLAAVMAMRPQVLLLDEPMSQLDSFAAAELLNELERLRADGVCIVLVEHRLDDVLTRVDRLLVLDGGRLVADATASDAEAVEAALVKGGLEAPEVWRVARAAEGFERTAGETAFVDNSLRELKSDSRSESATILKFGATTFSFPGAAAPLWRDVAFTLRDGDRVAVVGPNGAGKSTLLNVIAEQTAIARTSSVGLVLQNPDLMLFCDSVADELAFGPRELGLDVDTIRSRIAAAAEKLSLNDLLAEPPQALSQGQRLRTAVAATLALAPRVLLLDEPTTGQDQRQVTRVLAALSDAVTQAEGPLAGVRAMLFSTHDLRFVAQFANRVLVLAEGRLLADYTPAALLADDDMLARARLRRPPLLELRQRLGLHGLTANEMLKELRP